ncbi:MAG: NAD(+)/NADH kinase [Bacteroidales bacterium]|nr:NAD(+)/NADH kinase [Bacteroidales bacterium]
MKIALYSRELDSANREFIEAIILYLQSQQSEVVAHTNCATTLPNVMVFQDHEELKNLYPVDFMVSVGGDGTFIDTINLVRGDNIPVVGINTGRIGFLAGIKKERYKDCFEMLQNGRYKLEERSLLHIESSEPLPLQNHSVINDITVRTLDTDTINGVTVHADDQVVNTYWGDGVIIATPTGSTAYSMGCGGPIMHPQSSVQVITPIAPHSLSVRPLVIPAESRLSLSVSSRSGKYALIVDTQHLVVENHVKIFIQKELFPVQTVLFEDTSFYDIIREKLLWGFDKRNF